MNQSKVLLSVFLLAGLTAGLTIHARPHTGRQKIANTQSTNKASQRPSITQHNIPERMIWNGKSGELSIRWTTVDLYRKSATNDERIFSPLVKKEVKDFAAHQEDSLNCQYERYFTVLSVVGTLVSFNDATSFYCGGAHPSLDNRFTTIDISKSTGMIDASGERASEMDSNHSKPGKVVKLTDYFSADDILTALLSDPVVVKAVGERAQIANLKTLAEIPELFADKDYELGDTGFELRPDYLTRFGFHHIEGNKVAVRISLPPHYGANHAKHLELGLLLPIPASLQTALTLADNGKAGFLMRGAPKPGANKTTSFKFNIE